MFDGCKWDPQVGDVRTLFPAPLVLHPGAWRELQESAEALEQEMEAAERAALSDPDLMEELGLPTRIAGALRRACVLGGSRAAFRCTRFDFHWTRAGWRISEANSDVPGGFIEGSTTPGLMALRARSGARAGDPIARLADAVARRMARGSVIALVHATAYVDDRQVMIALQRALEARGFVVALAAPDQIVWHVGEAWLQTQWLSGKVDLIFRFFPAEWLENLPAETGWEAYFAGARTPQVNPGTALISQSKRLPLYWDKLGVRVEAWRRLLPECADPSRRAVRKAPSREGWVFKPALGRVGEGVAIEGVTEQEDARKCARGLRRDPWEWVAQRRFESIPVESPLGPVHIALGVFVIDGRASGVFARAAARPLIDGRAWEVAALVAQPGGSAGKAEGRGAEAEVVESFVCEEQMHV